MDCALSVSSSTLFDKGSEECEEIVESGVFCDGDLLKGSGCERRSCLRGNAVAKKLTCTRGEAASNSREVLDLSIQLEVLYGNREAVGKF